MSMKCCRSNPRCAGCPVRGVAAARRRGEPSATAALVTEILGGTASRPLPQTVAAALEQLQVATSQSTR